MTTLDDLFVESPRAYAMTSLVVLAEAARLVAHVRPENLEELAGAGGTMAANFAQRDAIVELARAAKAFLEAARDARQKGAL